MRSRSREHAHLFGELEQLLFEHPGKCGRNYSGVVKEVQRLKMNIASSALSITGEDHLLRWVRFHQKYLIGIMDRVSHPSSHKFKLVDKEYILLEELLQFMRWQFDGFFDLDIKAPDRQIMIARSDMTDKTFELRTAFQDKGVDFKLVEAILVPMISIYSSPVTSFTTFRRLEYASKVYFDLRELRNSDRAVLFELLRAKLFYFNYNSIKVFLYYVRSVDVLIKDADSASDRLRQLLLVLKEVSQFQVKHGLAFNIFGTSLKDLVVAYLNDEITYLERVSAVNPAIARTEQTIAGFRFKLDMSVAQVAYMLKIFTESQFIQNTNVTEVLKFISNIIVTRKSETVSYDSLRAKYYNVEAGTKESVRKALVSLIQHVEKSTSRWNL